MSTTMTACKSCGKLNKVAKEKLKSSAPACGSCGATLQFHGAVSEVSEKDFWRIIKKADRPVIIDFWASWCGPCKIYGPVFEKASLQNDRAIFLKVNTEENPALGQQLGIRGIPATLVFNQGREVRRESGALPIDMVNSLI